MMINQTVKMVVQQLLRRLARAPITSGAYPATYQAFLAHQGLPHQRIGKSDW